MVYYVIIYLLISQAEGKPLEPSEFDKYGLNLDSYKAFVGEMISKSHELGIPSKQLYMQLETNLLVSKEVQEGLDELGIEVSFDPKKKDRLKDAGEEDLVKVQLNSYI